MVVIRMRRTDYKCKCMCCCIHSIGESQYLSVTLRPHYYTNGVVLLQKEVMIIF